MRRWNEQRWLLDNVIQAVGPDWDAPRLPHLNGALGPESTADINGIRQRVKKVADIEGAFVAVARRREARAKASEEAGEFVTARENYYMASNYWASAQWPIDESNKQNYFYNGRSVSASGNMPSLPTSMSRRLGFHFKARSFPVGSICPPTTQADVFRRWSLFPAWTVTRKGRCRSMAILGLIAGLRCSSSRARANTRRRCLALM